MSDVYQFVQENASALGMGLGALATATCSAVGYYLLSPPDPLNVCFSLDKQSVILEDGITRVSPLVKDGKLLEYLYEDCKTLYDSFQRGMILSKNGRCLGTRSGPNKEYVWMSYQQVADRARLFGSGLLQLGIEPNSENFLGIYSGNRVEWVLAEQACNTFSIVVIPLYDTLGPAACSYIVNQTRLSTVVCDTAEKAQLLLDQVDRMPSLRQIILIEATNNNIITSSHKYKITLCTFREVEELGRKHLQEPVPPKPTDLATLCYTSGTTGDPKGVMLTHRNLLTNISSVATFAMKYREITPEDRHLSYLPLAHMFERGTQFMLFMHGAQIGFFQGNVKLLLDDLQVLKPTVFPTVPRVLNRLYDKVQLSVKGSKVKSWLLRTAIAQKEKELQKCIIRRNSVWDMLMFRKLQNLIGGNVTLMITGSAPLSIEVLKFVRCAFGCVVLEGYGQTEATAGITFQIPGDFSAGNVGGPLPCNYVRLMDVPDMDYYAKDGHGEICAKGPSIFKGYYRNPEETAKVIDSDGWLHTGDIGMWLPNGTLKIIDRKKNIFKLAQGEYIAPEKVENVYLRSPYLSQAFVHGDSYKTCTVGIVVPDVDVFPSLAKELELQGDLTKLCSHDKIRQALLKDMVAQGQEAGLNTFEQVKDICVIAEPFSVQNGLLTPTFKNKRPALTKFFTTQIKELYRRLESSH